SSCRILTRRNSAGAFHLRARKVILTLLIVCLISSCASRRMTADRPREVTDEIGRSVRVPANPQRIVSLAPSITETLFAIGLGDRVVGVTSYCDYPPEATAKEKVGDTLRPSVERIVALRADLVVASTASQLEQFIRKLDELGIAVYVSNPRKVADVIETIERLGALTGADERASELSDKLQKRLAEIDLRVQAAPRPRVLIILSAEPLITAG